MTYGKPPLVEISWYDATGSAGWFDDIYGDTPHPIAVRTVGFMIQKDREQVRLCMHITDQPKLGDLFIIPRGCVKAINILASWSEIWEEKEENAK